MAALVLRATALLMLPLLLRYILENRVLEAHRSHVDCAQVCPFSFSDCFCTCLVFVVDHLSSGMYYSFSVQAHNQYGLGPACSSISAIVLGMYVSDSTNEGLQVHHVNPKCYTVESRINQGKLQPLFLVPSVIRGYNVDAKNYFLLAVFFFQRM